MNKKNSGFTDLFAATDTTVDGFYNTNIPFAAVAPLIAAASSSSNAAPSFATGGDGIISTDFSGKHDFGQAIALQTDGKILVAGYSGTSTNTDFAVTRYNSDGSLDSSFDGDGKATTAIGASFDFGYAVTVQKDGNILVSGLIYNGGNYDFALVRYNSNGSLDTRFSGDGKTTTDLGFTDFGFSVAAQSDGKILVAGFTNNGGRESVAVVRYTSTGALDTSFDGDGKAITALGNNGAGHAIAVQKDGKILVAGDSDHHFAVIRYNSNGSLDSSFDGDGKVSTAVSASNDYGTAMTLQSDGKILVAGYSKNTSNNYDFAVVRYTSNGTLDTSFDGDGKATTALGSADDKGQAITLQADGKILVSGFSYNGNSNDFAIVRYHSNGSLDTRFSGDGKLITSLGAKNDQAYSVSVQADGKILVSGATDNGGNNDFALIRYNADGSLDKTFDASNTLGGTVAYTENGTAVVLDSSVQIYDYELATQGHYNGASITLARHGGANAQDVFSGKGNLSFSGGNAVLSGVTIGTVSNSNGTLKITFNSNATQARVNAVLSSLAYSNSSDTPPNSVQIDWTFSDSNTGALGLITVNIAAANDAPTFIAGHNTNSYTENGTATVLNSGIQINDAELSAQGNYNGASVILARHGGAHAQDIFSGGGNLSFTGGNAVLSGVGIGTVSNSNGTLTITFNSNATPARVNGVLSSLAYSNTSDTPPASVQIDWTFNDGNTGAQGTGGALSGFSSTTVNISAINDAPTFAATLGGTVNFAENGTAVVLDNNVTLSDIELDSLGNYGGATLILARAGGANAQDVFSSSRFSGANVVVSGTTIGTFTQNGGSLTITFTANATQAVVNSALQTLAYSNSSNTPPASVPINWLFSDGNSGPQGTGGALTVAGLTTIAIAASNDAPSFGAGNNTTVFVEDGAGVVLNNKIQINDAELLTQSHYNGASVTLARHGNAHAQDIFSGGGNLSFTGGNAVLSGVTIGTVSNGNGTLTITFNSNATPARVDETLSSLTYRNTSTPPPASVTIDWTFNDGNTGTQGTGGALSALSSTTVNITPSNHLPTGSVTITGIATQGETLTANHTLVDADGLGIIIYTWKAGTSLLATGGTYTLTANDVGKAISVTASYQDNRGAKESVTSAATDLVGKTNTGSQNNDVLTGTNGNDTMSGGGGNDTLNGGAGSDRLAGNTGDDLYYIDNTGDTVVELAGEGNDTVFTSVNWVATGHVENIVLTGNAHIVTGNSLDNRITGGTGDDTIDGSLGNDVELGGGGNDRLVSGSGSDTLAGGTGDDTYVLTGGNGYIEDFLGIDTIDASLATGDSTINLTTGLCHVQGQDSHFSTPGTTVLPLDVQFLQDLSGSFYDDIANVANLAPAIVSALQAVQVDRNSKFGTSTFVDKPIAPFGDPSEWVYDTLLPLTTSATMLADTYNAMVIKYGDDEPEAQIEALMQLALHSTEVGFRSDSARFVILFTDAPYHKAGDGAQAGISTPNNGDAVIDGNGIGEDYPLIAQVQAALAAANIIPIFAVANGYEAIYQDLVTQLQRGAVVSLNDDSSNIVTAINAGLTAGTVTSIENAIGGVGNDTLTGNALDNVLTGNDGGDTLNGVSGHDSLIGGNGNDTYIIDDSHSTVTENANQGTDVVKSSVSYTLGVHVEKLGLMGGVAINGTGNDLANTLIGNTAANTLSGGNGNDVLSGGLGNDTLTGGAGQDVFQFNTALASNVDKITDFVVADDTIQLENAIFTKLTTPGVLNAGNFKSAAAADADDFIVYNSGTGVLLYDADGNGVGAAVQIATLGVGLALANADFMVV